MNRTPYQKFKEKWKDCQKCELAKQRRKIVMARGTRIPCDVLFVGEAPGSSENVIGRPFCGPAGHLMQRIIDEALHDHTFCLTNLVMCFPREAKSRGENEPPEEAILTCRPRLEEFIGLCKPKTIVAVGRLAAKYLYEYLEHEDFPQITHPAAILRMHVSQLGLAVQQCVYTIEDALESSY